VDNSESTPNASPKLKTSSLSFLTNWKFLAIVGVFALLTVGGILALKGLSPAPAEPTPPVIQQSSPPAPQPQTQKEVQWVGLLATEEGLLKLNSRGMPERDGSKYKTFLPPGFKDNPYAQLLEDGRLVLIGSPEIALGKKKMHFTSGEYTFQKMVFGFRS